MANPMLFSLRSGCHVTAKSKIFPVEFVTTFLRIVKGTSFCILPTL